MRRKRGWVSLMASLAGFLAGATTSDDVTVEAERGRPPTPRQEATGFAASGPSFYVWDEDSLEARRWAAELGGCAQTRDAGSPVNGGAPRSPA